MPQATLPPLKDLVSRIRVERVYHATIDDVSEDEFPSEMFYQSVWCTVEQASTPAEAKQLYVRQLTDWHKRASKWLRTGKSAS